MNSCSSRAEAIAEQFGRRPLSESGGAGKCSAAIVCWEMFSRRNERMAKLKGSQHEQGKCTY